MTDYEALGKMLYETITAALAENPQYNESGYFWSGRVGDLMWSSVWDRCYGTIRCIFIDSAGEFLREFANGTPGKKRFMADPNTLGKMLYNAFHDTVFRENADKIRKSFLYRYTWEDCDSYTREALIKVAGNFSSGLHSDHLERRYSMKDYEALGKMLYETIISNLRADLWYGENGYLWEERVEDFLRPLIWTHCIKSFRGIFINSVKEFLRQFTDGAFDKGGVPVSFDIVGGIFYDVFRNTVFWDDVDAVGPADPPCKKVIEDFMDQREWDSCNSYTREVFTKIAREFIGQFELWLFG